MTKDKGFEKQMYDKARANLLLMIILTIINIVLFFLGSETVMLFSATIPYMSILIGVLSEIDGAIQVCAVFTIAIMVMYFMCWILSKRNPIWMIIAMVMFVIDTVALICIYVGIQEAAGIIDLITHIWVFYYLFIGVRYGYKLKKISSEGKTKEQEIDSFDEIVDTDTLYIADMNTKYRVLAEANVPGYEICYRRVKKTNELVINNYVYDTKEMLIEPPHKLMASINGHIFEVGYDGMHSYIRADDQLLVRKIRVW